MKIENAYELTGLYSGVALTLELHSAPSQIPPMVWLYRMPILDEWAATGDITLEELVAHVVVHELGHHFGWSDEEMDLALDDGALDDGALDDGGLDDGAVGDGTLGDD
jgi:predicted Zn-dependent protease with MMP-like domain